MVDSKMAVRAFLVAKRQSVRCPRADPVAVVATACCLSLLLTSSIGIAVGGSQAAGGARFPCGRMDCLKLHSIGRSESDLPRGRCLDLARLSRGLLEGRYAGYGASPAILALRGGGSAGADMEIDTVHERPAGQQADVRDVEVRWKGRSIAVSFDVSKPAEELKQRLWELTDVEPEKQFLLGIYKQDQDVDLESLGVKQGQSLVLLGEPNLGSFARAKGMPTGPEKLTAGMVLPDGYKRGFCTMANTDQETLFARDPWRVKNMKRTLGAGGRGEGRMEDGSESSQESVEDERNAGPDQLHHQTIEETLDIDKFAVRSNDLGAVTVPSEFRHKNLTNLTMDEGERLRQWINETRDWRIQTKMDRALEASVNQSIYREEGRRAMQAAVDTFADREEKKLNAYGLSRIKSRMIVQNAREIFHKSDYLYNDTTAERLQPYLIGGMNWDDSARYVEEMDQIRALYQRAAKQKYFDARTQERYDRLMEDERHRQALEESGEPSSGDEIPDEHWDVWIKTLREHEGYPGYLASIDKPLEDIPRSHPCADELRQPNINIVDKIDRLQKRGELRDWVNFGWPDPHRLPNGLSNIGNTCYMAAAMQMLRAVPELMLSLREWKRQSRGLDVADNLIEASQLLLKDLAEKEDQPSAPHSFMYHLRQILPQFAQIGPMGPQQQDSEEALSGILMALSSKLKSPTGSNLIKELFEIELETQTWCHESDTEEPTYDTQRLLRLPLPIDKSTKTLHDSLGQTLVGQLEKHSPTLNRTAHYNTTMEISRLPPYVIMQYMRFYWRTDTNKKAKICKSVHFPLVIDLLDYLSDELKAPIELNLAKRKAKFFSKKPLWHAQDMDELPRKFAEWDRKQTETALMAQMGFLNMSDMVEVNEDSDDEDANLRRNATEAAFQAARERWLDHVGREEEKEEEDRGQEEDLAKKDVDSSLQGASQFSDSAMYQLRAVITHQSRYAEAGHYITYVRSGIRKSSSHKRAPEPVWLKFDDEKVTIVTENEVRNTAGGADNPISYVCLYGRSDAVAEGLSSTQY